MSITVEENSVRAILERNKKRRNSQAKRDVENMWQHLEMSDGCLIMIQERLESLGEDMSQTPAMNYPEAIVAVIYKRLKEAGVFGHKPTVKYVKVEGKEAFRKTSVE